MKPRKCPFCKDGYLTITAYNCGKKYLECDKCERRIEVENK